MPSTTNSLPIDCLLAPIARVRAISCARDWTDMYMVVVALTVARTAYKKDRNLVEQSNGHIKGGSKEALEDSARRMLRGLTAQQVLVTFLVVVANMRRVFSYRDEMQIPEEKQRIRKPRARNSRSVRSYDPRIAAVREAQGLPPLLNSRRKDAKEDGSTASTRLAAVNKEGPAGFQRALLVVSTPRSCENKTGQLWKYFLCARGDLNPHVVSNTRT
jgi:hypothetical protein